MGPGDVPPWDLKLELHYGGAARRDGRRLDVRRYRRADPPLVVDTIEDLPDNMERRRPIGAAHAEEDPDRLADLGLHRMLGCERPDGAVEDEVLRTFREQLLHAELVVAALPVRPIGVELALHDVELVINLRQPLRRLDEDQPVHPTRNVV